MQLADLTARDLAHGRVVLITTRLASTFRVRKGRTSDPRRAYVAEHPVEFYPSGLRYFATIDELRKGLATL